MPNAFADNTPNAFAQSPPMGSGLAQGAGDVIRLHKQWQDAFINGDTELQFPAWLKENGAKNPVMPR